jgi:hypothetical protein
MMFTMTGDLLIKVTSWAGLTVCKWKLQFFTAHSTKANKICTFSFTVTEVMLCLIFCYLTGRRGRDHMVIGFATTVAISAYHNYKILNLCKEIRTIQIHCINYFLFTII